MPDYHAHGYDRMTDAELLSKVQKGWKSEETPCGAGSTIESTRLIRSYLPRIADQYGISSVVDAGAGDLHWIRSVQWGVEYRGFDLHPRHPNVIKLDITKEVLPKADMILCRHVLNHLSIQFSERAIEKFRASEARYLLMTNCDNQRDYWAQYGLSVGHVIETWKDAQHWDLELYAL